MDVSATNEADRIERIPLADVRGMIDRSKFPVGLLYVLMDEAVR